MNSSIDQVPTVMQVEQMWMLVQQAPLTHKEYGQLGTLRDRCGPDTLPLIKYVMHGWPEFTDRVKQQMGFKSVPPLPHVGFLLRFCRIAVAMMRAKD